MINFRNYPNLTKIVIPNSVQLTSTDFSNAFSNMQNLTSIKLSDKVTNISNAFAGCVNLTTAVCGDKVTNMHNTYFNCPKLTTAVCGPNVTDMRNTYRNCPNIQGNAYLYNVTNAYHCFYGRNTSNMLNIYTYKPDTFINSTSNITGYSLTWTKDTANKCWYNTYENIYVYQL